MKRIYKIKLDAEMRQFLYELLASVPAVPEWQAFYAGLRKVIRKRDDMRLTFTQWDCCTWWMRAYDEHLRVELEANPEDGLVNEKLKKLSAAYAAFYSEEIFD